MKSIKDFVNKGGCEGKHTLSYGSYQEHQQEILLAEAVENLEETEEKERPIKEIPQQALTNHG
jgi:hypothetical protein